MIELQAYKVPLKLCLHPGDIRGVREIFDSRKQVRKHTQIYVHNNWTSVQGSYEEVKSKVGLNTNTIGYK